MAKFDPNPKILRKYFPGLSDDQIVAEYNRLLQEQNHCCAICGKHQSQFARALAVEHCHETLRVRGLACYYCNNKVIGKLAFKNALAMFKYIVKNYPEFEEEFKKILKK